MRIVVVGGAGFVGGHVVDALQKVGHDVVIGDTRPSKWHPTTMHEFIDVQKPETLLSTFDGAQVVMHLAAISNTQMALKQPALAVSVNCLGTANVLVAAADAGVERVLVAGSTLVSGLLEPFEMEHPLDAYEDGVLDAILDAYGTDEDSPIVPRRSVHPYVTTKLFQELLARDFGARGIIDTTVLRYGIQYGPRMTPGVVVHTFIERALRGDPLILHGDGQQWRQYLHVADMAQAHVDVLEHWEESRNEVFNICPPFKVSIADIAEAVCMAIPKTTVEYGPPRPDDIDVQMCMPGKAKAALGWEPDIMLERGVPMTVDWYRRHQASGMPRPR